METFIDPQSRPAVIIVFTEVAGRPSVKTKQILSETMFATGETVGLAEWINDDTCLVSFDLKN